MNFNELALKDSFIIHVESFIDNRGIFEKIFCKDKFDKIGYKKEIVQINHSLTREKGTVRGLHFQYPPYSEIKIIKCIKGSVFDVIIDIRKNSPTFLKWHSEILSLENKKMIYIPEGFAHGFQTLEDDSELLYLHTEFYNKESEGAIRYDDPLIGVKWPLDITEISDRDKSHSLLDINFEGVNL